MDAIQSVAGGRGSRSSGRSLVHLGMLLAGLAFASWWTSHTILDTARTRRVTDAVIGNVEVRRYVAQAIAPIATQTVGAPMLSRATGAAGPQGTSSPADVLTARLTTVLDRHEIRAKLEQFVVDAHEVLIGQRTAPAVLDKATVVTLVNAAVPSLTLPQLAQLPPVTIKVPRVAPLSAGRKALRDRTWWYVLGALALLGLAVATSRDRHSTVKLVGRWLIGISVAHLLVLWVFPVVVVPQLSRSPWVGLVASVARALNAGLVVGLVVLAGAGVACLFVDLFVPATRGTPSPLPQGATTEG